MILQRKFSNRLKESRLSGAHTGTPLRLQSLAGIVLLCLLVIGIRVNAQGDSSSFDVNRIRRATVFIIQASGNDLDTRCIGSGTIVRFDGLILTNAHNVVPFSIILIL